MSHKVYNWQINRKMEYEYPQARPRKQAAWVFDINKCIACQTCTFACKNAWTSGRGQEYMWWNNVETKPWGFYPLGWDVRILEKLGPQRWRRQTYKGKTIFEAAPFGEKMLGFIPEPEDYQSPNIGEDEGFEAVKKGQYMKLPHQSWMFYMQRICNHCTYPACLAACPRKAIYKRKEDGIVLIDQKRCRGYQECVRACPYKKSFFRAETKKSEKCISCFPAIEQGEQTQCVVNCIGKIRLFGFKNHWQYPNPDNPIDYLVHVKKVALPLYPQFGLEPNVYYIPALNASDEFNLQLFGPGAKDALNIYRRSYRDKKFIAALVLMGCTDKIVHSFKAHGTISNGEAIGYDANAQEIVRVPLTEPIIIRKNYDEKRNVHRISIS
ncbi:MAG: dehydrogenase [Omnitrophica bacterium]|nr:dehydrogenase [Candidatus Omnitrophota bacterium]